MEVKNKMPKLKVTKALAKAKAKNRKAAAKTYKLETKLRRTKLDTRGVPK